MLKHGHIFFYSCLKSVMIEKKFETKRNKFALLWGEAQLCLFALCLLIEKIAYSYPKVTYSYPRVTYSDPKASYSEPKVTHGDPSLHTSPYLYLPHLSKENQREEATAMEDY